MRRDNSPAHPFSDDKSLYVVHDSTYLPTYISLDDIRNYTPSGLNFGRMNSVNKRPHCLRPTEDRRPYAEEIVVPGLELNTYEYVRTYLAANEFK